MNKLNCYIVKDLLPLYIDKICCEQTAQDIEEHLYSCSSCRKLYEEMNSEMPLAITVPEFEEKKMFRCIQKNLFGIMGALLVTIICILLNIKGAWNGGPAEIGNLIVSGFYILFWSLFSFFSRKYIPFVNFSIVISSFTLFSSLISFVSVLSGRGGFITAFLSIFASVPFYGFRYFMDWTGFYGTAVLFSLFWLAYSYTAKYRISFSKLTNSDWKGKLKIKKRVIMTAGFLLSLIPMLLNQYGGRRGVQEISGLINLANPIGVISIFAFIIGVWGIYKNKSVNRILGVSGTVGIVIAELYEFFTWHVLNITGKVSLKNSIRFAFPEFYIGLAVSVAMIFIFIIIDKKIEEK